MDIYNFVLLYFLIRNLQTFTVKQKMTSVGEAVGDCPCALSVGMEVGTQTVFCTFMPIAALFTKASQASNGLNRYAK